MYLAIRSAWLFAVLILPSWAKGADRPPPMNFVWIIAGVSVPAWMEGQPILGGEFPRRNMVCAARDRFQVLEPTDAQRLSWWMSLYGLE